MNLSLSNTLGKRMAINSDGLSLDLAFALDKTLTARQGPTPTFTRASTATFVGDDGLIQSAAVNEARFDHDPVTIASRGLLIEEARTNFFKHSEEFNNAGSISSNISVTPNTTIAPDGLLTADTVDFTNASSFIYQTIGSVEAGTTYTFSVYLASLTKTQTVLRVVTVGVGAAATAIISLTPTLTRYSLLFTVPAGSTSILAGFENRVGVAGGNGSTGTIVAWGAQLEIGAFPTSYIPTTTAALTRSADVCSITGGDFTSFYNQNEGTVSVNTSTPAIGDRTVVGIDNNTADEMIRIRTEGTDPFYKVTDAGIDVVALDLGAVVARTPFRIAAAYKLNDFAASLNGAAVGTDNTGIIPTVDRLRIGQGQAGNIATGHISRLQYFRKRLANAKLQTLTT